MGRLVCQQTRSEGVTNTGNIRSHNEDAFINLDQQQLWAVADGMGGHQSGEVASRMIVDALATYRATPLLGKNIRQITSLLQAVNQQLVELADNDADKIIGSTIAILLLHGRYCAALWAGDSRVYRYRKGLLKQITRDHSEAELLRDAGITPEEISNLPYAESITRAVGADTFLQLEAQIQEIQAGDIYLLCSDGLYKELDETDMAQIMSANDIKTSIQQLLATALKRQGRDNITIVVIEIQ